jgi:hypothetical protein
MNSRLFCRYAALVVCGLAMVGCKSKSSGNGKSSGTGEFSPTKAFDEDKTSAVNWLGGQSPYQLVNRESVRADIKMTAEQFGVVQLTQREESTKASTARKERNEKEGKPANRADLKGTTTMMAALDAKVREVLTETQITRLEQIAMQYRVHHHGVLWLFHRKSIQQKLGMNSQQREMVETLVRDESATLEAIKRSRDPNSVKPTLDRFYHLANEQLIGELSDAQRKTWTEILGAPFDLAAGGFAVKK